MDYSVTVIVYGPFSNKGSSGLGYFHYQIVKSLLERKVLKRAYCLLLKDQRSNIDIPEDKYVVANDNLLFKAGYYALRILNRVYKRFNDRYFSEIWFDSFVRKRINYQEADVFLYLKPGLASLSEEVKKRGKINLTFADVAHPEFICEMVRKIEQRYGVRDSSSYTHQKRIKRLLTSYHNSEYVIPIVESSFVFDTYRTRGLTNLMQVNAQNFINPSYFEAKEHFVKAGDTINFVTVAQFNYKKGLPLLLEAWKYVADQPDIKVHLHVIGSINKSTKTVVDKWFKGLKEVTFHGYTNNMKEVYRKYDVFIASSVSDTGPRTVPEAMASTLPCIVSSHCGAADLIREGANGYTYDPFDIEKLQQLIVAFSRHPEKIAMMGTEARKTITSADFRVFLDGLNQGINEVVHDEKYSQH